ncbi:MAG: leucyl aminopeptidase [Campylobacterales bacterium]
MDIDLSSMPLAQISADIELIFVVSGEMNHRFVRDASLLEECGFTGKEGQKCYLAHVKRLYVGIASIEWDELRTGCAQAIRALRNVKASSLKVGAYAAKRETNWLAAMVEGFLLGDYSFDRYKSTKENHPIENVTISLENFDASINLVDDIQILNERLKRSLIVSDAVNFTRDVANSAPDDMTPSMMASLAAEMAREEGLEISVYDENWLEENGLGAFLAVSRASAHAPRLIHLTYTPQERPVARVALVGKGLTYDSGGLSLKPSEHMITMKADKSGASAILGIMSALAKMELPIEVHGVIGATENMIGGNAYKPDDILVAKNGKTIEVRNTDAEGRLVLADCLCYIQDYAKENEFELDAILDFATLTGACVVGLGEYTIGLMGHNKKLKESIEEAAFKAGELIAELPFNPYLKELLKSQVADICNISSSRYGGAITAALFLSEFISEENRQKWAHLDIAGPAFVEKEWGCNPHGASGAGVRLALQWLEELATR